MKHFSRKDNKQIFPNVTTFPFPFNVLDVAGSSLLDLLFLLKMSYTKIKFLVF
jgi:hypothetical protein